MQNNGLETRAGALFFSQHGAPDDVQAVRLGGRSMPFIDAEDQPLFIGDQRGDGIQRRLVVGIDADENPVILASPAGERVAQHRRDHIRFAPGRDENGDAPWLRGGGQGGCRHPLMARIDGQPAPEQAAQEQHVDDEIIDTADRQSRYGEQQNLMMHPRQKDEDQFFHGSSPCFYPRCTDMAANY